MQQDSPKAPELYVVSRAQIENNDIGIGLRLIWLNNCLAFMFGVYAGITLYRSPAPELFVQSRSLNMAIPWIGVGVSLFTLFDIITGIVRINKIRKNYEQVQPEPIKGIPGIDGTWNYRLFQRLSPVAQGLLFLVIWTFILMYDQQWL